MKLRTIIRIAIISSIVLLCTGFIMFSFFKLSRANNDSNFNLYSLIPSNASAVFETNDIVGLVQDIDEMACSKDNHYLPISRLFSSFKSYLNSLLEETPHGLSKQMNTMLFSFHEPDNDSNQVLYCSLGSGDYKLLEKFVAKLNTGDFPSRLFEYKGEKIRIYPMPDGSFISCYITSKFLVLSYQKRLIEQVVDAYISGKSLMNDPFFVTARKRKKQPTNATIYTRMYSLDMGKSNGNTQVHANVGNWTEFDMKLNGTAIYFSGVSHDQDSCNTFMNILRKQEPVKGFPDGVLPLSTFFFSRRSVSDMEAMLHFTAEQEYMQAPHSDYVKERDMELSDFLKQNGGENITTCLFHRADTANTPAAVMSIPLKDALQAERLLKILLNRIPSEAGYMLSQATPRFQWTTSGYHKFYTLPHNTLFTQLTGIANSALNGYACFYNERLLLAPDGASLVQYLQHLEKTEILDSVPAYREGISALSDTYHFMLVADLGDMIALPDTYTRLIPTFFFRNPEFFRYFTLSAQFVCNEEAVYPNIVLSYKGEVEE